MNKFKIGKKIVGENKPTYFIADIAANHDGDLSRAKDLIWLAKEAGADCAKFQHFLPQKIVSDFGFQKLKKLNTHQSQWKKSVFDIYQKYHTRRNWTTELVKTCQKASIEFMTTPYDIEIVNDINKFVSAFKIGSGDITYHKLIKETALKNKPILLACGASTLDEIEMAIKLIKKYNNKICLMQCNTNYTGSLDNFKFINLNVLKFFHKKWPNMILGLSDHTPGHSTVIGAITLGAKVIEKHFTDNNNRIGPDHSFAMNPTTWKNMIDASKEIEFALGDGIKKIEKNEIQTSIIQKRSIRCKINLVKGHQIKEDDLIALRPASKKSIKPYHESKILKKKLNKNKKAGEELFWSDIIKP